MRLRNVVDSTYWLLKVMWSTVTGRPILIPCPEAIDTGEPFPPQLNAKLLLTKIQFLNKELDEPVINQNPNFLTIQQEAITFRTKLLNQVGYDLSILEPNRKESEVVRLSQAIGLSVDDSRKILDYTPTN